eukprot:scaffold80_cov325-Pavlova_lutheri.AAC.48
MVVVSRDAVLVESDHVCDAWMDSRVLEDLLEDHRGFPAQQAVLQFRTVDHLRPFGSDAHRRSGLLQLLLSRLSPSIEIPTRQAQ